MKIAIFTDNFYPELSGISDSVLVFGKTLAERGHQILYVAPRYAKRDYAAINNQSIIDKKNIFEYRLPSFLLPGSPTGHGRVAISTGLSLLSLKKFAPDIIHTHSPFGAGIEAYLVSKILGIPLVGTNHTPPSEFVKYTPIRADWFKKLSIKFYCGYYNRCSFVSTPCKSLLDEMKNFGFHRKALVISNPIEISRFQPVENKYIKEELKNKFGLSEHTILYTGRLAEEKYIDVIIESLIKIITVFPNAVLAIAGHGNAEKSLVDLVNKLGLQKNVKFLGYVEGEIMPLLYQASDLFVIMSTCESQSLSLFQAMSSGLPVIGARARALPEYINKTNGIIIEPGDKEGLATEIIKILGDNELAKSLGRGGIETAKITTPKVVTEEWERIYKEAIDSK